MNVTSSKSSLFSENGDVMIMIMSTDVDENGLSGVFSSQYCLSKLQIKLDLIFRVVRNVKIPQQLYVLKFSCANDVNKVLLNRISHKGTYLNLTRFDKKILSSFLDPEPLVQFERNVFPYYFLCMKENEFIRNDLSSNLKRQFDAVLTLEQDFISVSRKTDCALKSSSHDLANDEWIDALNNYLETFKSNFIQFSTTIKDLNIEEYYWDLILKDIVYCNQKIRILPSVDNKEIRIEGFKSTVETLAAQITSKASQFQIISNRVNCNHAIIKILKLFKYIEWCKENIFQFILIEMYEDAFEIRGIQENITKALFKYHDMISNLKETSFKISQHLISYIQVNLDNVENFLYDRNILVVVHVQVDSISFKHYDENLAIQANNLINELFGVKILYLNQFEMQLVNKIYLDITFKKRCERSLFQIDYDLEKMSISCAGEKNVVNLLYDELRYAFLENTRYTKQILQSDTGLYARENFICMKGFLNSQINNFVTNSAHISIETNVNSNNKFTLSMSSNYENDFNFNQYLKRNLNEKRSDFIILDDAQYLLLSDRKFHDQIRESISKKNAVFLLNEPENQCQNDVRNLALNVIKPSQFKIEMFDAIVINKGCKLDTSLNDIIENNNTIKKVQVDLSHINKNLKFLKNYIKNAFFDALLYNDSKCFKSLAITFPFSKKLMNHLELVDLYIQIIFEYLKNSKIETLIERVVLVSEEYVNDIVGILKERIVSFEDTTSPSLLIDECDEKDVLNMIEIRNCSIVDPSLKCDAIVNSTDNKFDLDNGQLSRIILHQAGPNVQNEINSIFQNGTHFHNVVISSAGELVNKKYILNCYLPAWSECNVEIKFKILIQFLLLEANRLGLKSIAFPALGSGLLKYPRDEVPKLIYEAVNEFLSDYQTSISSIYFTAFDLETLQTFSNFKQNLDSERLFNSQKIKPYSNTLTESDTDVIINPTGYFFSQDSPISQNLLLNGGFEINKELNNKFNQSDVILFTTGGLLKCSKILHVDLSGVLMDVNSTLLRALNEINIRGYQSVTIPVSDQHFMSVVFNSISNFFLNSTNFYLNEIKICFDNECTEPLKNFMKESCKFFKKISKKSDKMLRINILNVAKLISNNVETIHQAKDLIAEKLSENTHVYTFTNTSIGNLTQSAQIEIENECKRSYYTYLEWNLTDSTCKLIGQNLNLFGCIHYLSNRLKEEEEKKLVKMNAPVSWDPSKELHLVDLDQSSKEYQDVLDSIRTSGFNTFKKVVTIQRVQNKELFIQYQAMRQIFNNRYPVVPFEYTLYHGTRQKCVDNIWRRGFNRAFAGFNGFIYGKGVYFAKSASYSNSYTDKNSTGRGHMLVCKVLVGRYEKGSQSMLTPNEGFDTTVDDVRNPTIFSIFHDSQAYPEYLSYHRSTT